MSATRLLVLGSVRELGRAHGYQVRRDLHARGVHLWAKTRQGSIYHALGMLHRDGLLSIVTESAGSTTGPAKTEYAITEQGETAFFELLEQALCTQAGDIAESIAGIGFMTELPRARVLELLGQRVQAYQKWRAEVVDVYQADQDDWMHHVEAINLWAHTADSAISWTRDFMARLERGDYTMAGETSQDYP